MNCFESASYCNLQEYTAGEQARLRPEQLHVEELYMVMMALANSTKAQAAAKLPSRVHTVTITTGGLYEIEFSFLNNDLQPQMETDGIFDDGYWINAKGNVVIGKKDITSGYFKGYEDDIEKELQEIASGLHADSTGTGKTT